VVFFRTCHVFQKTLSNSQGTRPPPPCSPKVCLWSSPVVTSAVSGHPPVSMSAVLRSSAVVCPQSSGHLL
ncbi:unnamed protein product, partial [Staurois parvus]